MKTTAKTQTIGSESGATAGSDAALPFQAESGGTEAPLVIPRSPIASASPMTERFLGFEDMRIRLIATGFQVPRMDRHRSFALDRWVGRRLSQQLHTPANPESIARQWFIRFMARETGTGGVAAIQTRLKLNVTPIKRWIRKSV
jgi:hypothetical protein